MKAERVLCKGGLQTFVAGGSGAWQHERFSAAEQHAPGHRDDEFLPKKIGPSWKTGQAVDDDVYGMPDVAAAQGAGAVSTAESNSGAILHPIAQDLDVFTPMTRVPGYTASVDGGRDFRIGCCRRGVGAWAYEVSGVMPHVFIFEEGCRFEPILRMVPLAPLIVMPLTRLALGADPAR